ncbi:putative proteinase inhibitor I13, potato inhibitor I [Helianthus annuus]|uniref:Proteinase inhibitor I13 n=1 Tax=Helianthus annuus TaxID=4232 RepID=A0A9K3JWT4_HELAN|nr:uncharacterized protein LOC110937706 isoform X2 [Helianthus annuus]KAF5821997.1 putative proteinase inhibitor I13, potato inhibitor I [Helianthus annuus]KAJ0611587.1 putative proteinase inhibitor I13, potato inhibitor I [Helianthus annuus]KAJ0626892.1 putative proteinase inhibitor I13, potato inhibitor I [Helianthus annuus]KAJ0783226.1 putative proteinase inhibitor I13, potato inhibitor I [Helianthus annuus]KAJ0807401.1 putative proteinase inhibitor I13, potato inhibitor I [Helianthus annuu
MTSISASISTSSPSFSLPQKPTIIPLGSPFLRFPSMIKMGKVRCSIEDKPAITSDDLVKPIGEDDFTPQAPCPEGTISIGTTGKSSWPELVGEKGVVAAAIIEKENPLVNAIILPENSPATLDYRTDRVRVWVNSEGVVIRTPVIT